MAVTIDEILLLDALSLRLRFRSDRTAPVRFSIYRNGELASTFVSFTNSGQVDVFAGADQPSIEITDLASQKPQPAFPERFTLYWKASGNVSYRIEENISSVWTQRDTVPDNGSGSYVWNSRRLEDVASHQFRVIAIDSSGAEATALSYTALMVRRPDVPEVSYTYNGSGDPTLTIS